MFFKQRMTTNKTKYLVIKDTSKTLGNKKILNHINMTLHPNSIHALIGPNGAGKTTLIRIILGLFKADTGSIDYPGNPEDISAMLEVDYLFETKTAWENLEYFCSLFELDFDTQREKIMRYAKILRIDEDMEQKTAYFSKGMKRKFSLLISLLRDCDVLILDEPTSGVDPEARLRIREMLFKLKEEGKTILITSHDLPEIQKCADTISIIQNGRILNTFENNETFDDLEEIYFNSLRVE